MIIRPADIDDAYAIATIHVRSWQHAYADILPADGLAALSVDQRATQWAGWLQAESHPMHTLVAEIDGVISGFASWGPSSDPDAVADVPMLYSIYTSPDAMNRGVGTTLLHAIEVEMIADGATAGTLHVLAENAPTRAFYEHHGWLLDPGSEQTEAFFGMEMRTVRYRKGFLDAGGL